MLCCQKLSASQAETDVYNCCTVSEMYSQSMLYATKTFILALAWAALCLPPLISRINRKIMPK